MTFDPFKLNIPSVLQACFTLERKVNVYRRHLLSCIKKFILKILIFHLVYFLSFESVQLYGSVIIQIALLLVCTVRLTDLTLNM